MKAMFHYKNLLVAMTINISVPPFSAASFFHLSQIEAAICDKHDLVFPLHKESIRTHRHKIHTKGLIGGEPKPSKLVPSVLFCQLCPINNYQEQPCSRVWKGRQARKA